MEDKAEVPLDQEQKAKEEQNRSGSAASSQTGQSNPQGGSALTSPPEGLRKDERMDEDENDILPPGEVSTSTRNLKVSYLTQDDDSTVRSTITAPAERKATAMIKLRVWDPAHPHNRGKAMVATNVQLPANMISTAGAQHESGISSLDISTQRIDQLLLSSVKEEPDKPSTRGDSYFDALENVEFSLLGQSTIDINDGRQIMPQHEQLEVGSKISIRTSLADALTQGSGMSVASTASMGVYSAMKRPASWKVGNSAHLEPVQMLSIERISGFRDLRFQIKHNSPNLHELVLDGLPPNSINLLDFETLMDALGQNESIKRLSMRNSNVTDEMASSLALALVKNTNLTQLSLENNLLTNESAKNLYMVLNQNNSTLRLLDLTGNGRMDDDTIEAMDHFMEQRALKRTLRNGAEKARRAARGMLPGPTLEEDNIDAFGLVTVVCLQSVIDGTFESDEDPSSEKRGVKLDSLVETSDQRAFESATSDKIASFEPYTGEHSRDYTATMKAQECHSESDSHYRQSRPGAFSSSLGSSFDERLARKTSGKYRPSPYTQLDGSRNTIAFDYAHSANSSISSRSTFRSKAVVTDLDPQKNQQFDESDEVRQTADRDEARPVTFADSTAETSHPRMWVGENHEALSAQRYASTPTLASRHDAPVCPPPRRTTLDISGADYIDMDKTNEIELRRQLATEGGAVGAYQINEVAPSRQNRLSGNSSGRGARRGRVGRSESARMRRLAEIQGSDAPGSGSTAIMNASNNTAGQLTVEDRNDVVFDAEIQRTDDFERSRRESMYSKSLRSLGLDEEEGTLTDRIVCGGMIMLLIGLLVLVVIFMLQK